MPGEIKARRSSLQVELEYWLFLFAAALAGIPPLRAAYRIADICGRLIFRFNRKQKERVIQHLMHAGVAKDRGEAIEIGRRNFIHFAKLVVEIVVSPRYLKKDNLSDFVTISGPEESKRLFFNPGKSRNCILICAHFGNWEMAGQAYTLLSGVPLLSVMRPFDNPRIGEYILGSRVGGMHTVCDKRGAFKPLLLQMKKSHSVAFLVDQHANAKEGVVTSFFGHPARTHKSPAVLHLKTGVPILLMMPRRASDDFKFELIISDPMIVKPGGNPDEDVVRIMQMINDETEKVIRRYPEQWLWAHRRWLDINR